MDKILAYLNNYFYRFGVKGNFKIEDNKIKLNGTYIKGQYIKLEGSLMNDTVYKVKEVIGNVIEVDGATNEEFEGYVYSLAIPPTLIKLETEINEFETKQAPTNISSESFGNYSYSVNTNKNGDVADWKDVFRSQLKPFRKIYDTKRNLDIIENVTTRVIGDVLKTSDDDLIGYN